MACSCGKNKRLPAMKNTVLAGATREEQFAGTHVYFYAIPPEGKGEPEQFYTLREARVRAQRGGYGWEVEGRREKVPV